MEAIHEKGGPRGGPLADSSNQHQEASFSVPGPPVPELRSQRSVKFAASGSTGSSGFDAGPWSGDIHTDISAGSAGSGAASEGQGQGPVGTTATRDAEEGSTSSSSSTGDKSEEKGGGPGSLVAYRSSRMQRIGSRVYNEDNKPSAKVLDAAIKTLESSALLRTSSKEEHAEVAKEAPAPSPVSV